MATVVECIEQQVTLGLPVGSARRLQGRDNLVLRRDRCHLWRH